ncbi:unnamed protein product [Acanthoscelides obtectus]|uniref:Uncharacterized protein n=1 Tax=Acanthoscelides obtectus TaxID=200917 RepID=A0A9P0K617_ACAOB|nr:unnamed protein product [Acanthoscelides obtectus]CAK1676764.1 hypothetical protein AOBTE_LOCUS30927 [Acanthoscelides obtectus]
MYEDIVFISRGIETIRASQQSEDRQANPSEDLQTEGFYTFRRSKAIRRKELPPRLAAIQTVQSVRKVDQMQNGGQLGGTVQRGQGEQKVVRCDLKLQNNKFRYTKCLRRLKMKEVRLKQVIRYGNFRPERRKPSEENRKIAGKATEKEKAKKAVVEFGWITRLKIRRKTSQGSDVTSNRAPRSWNGATAV